MEHTEPIKCPIEPPKNDNLHFRIDEIEGKRVIEGKKAVVIGAGAPRNEEIIKAVIEVAKNNHIKCPIEPPKNDNLHFRIDEIEGKRVIEGKKAVVIGAVEDVDKYLSSPNVLNLNRDFAVPYLEAMSRMPLPTILDLDTPNKLQLLKNLNLSPEQIDYFQNAPPQRLEGESQKDYKTRRMLNKLIIKYRGQF